MKSPQEQNKMARELLEQLKGVVTQAEELKLITDFARNRELDGLKEARDICKSTIDENGMADANECADRIQSEINERINKTK